MRKKILAILLSIAMVLGMMPAGVFYTPVYAGAQNNTAEVRGSINDTEKERIINALFKEDVFADDSPIKITNIEIGHDGGSNQQVGTFELRDNVLDFTTGVALSTGNLKNDLNDEKKNKSTAISGNKTVQIGSDTLNDPCSIEFDLTLSNTNSTELTLNYALGSEEYMKYSIGKYNDQFAIYVNGENYAKIPGTEEAICIGSVNQVNNTVYFKPNQNYKGGITSLNLPIELNGLTKTFTAAVPLKKNETNHFKIVIGDKYDSGYDSVLFLQADSFKLTEAAHKFDPGILEIEKNGGTVSVKRLRKDNNNASTDGTISFTLVEENMLGEKFESNYFIEGGQSSVTLDIADDTKNIQIKDAKMGASINTNKDTLALKIAPPVLTKKEGNTSGIKDTIVITGIAGAAVTLYKNGVEVQNTNYKIGNDKTLTLTAQDAAKYKATQTVSNFNGVANNSKTSGDSNVIIVKKPPTISAKGNQADKAFKEDTISKSDNAYSLTDFGVKAYQSDGTTEITNTGNTEPYFHVENPLENNCKTPGIYTIKWTAKDGGYIVTETKVVKVKPDAPKVFKDDYKDSVIYVEGDKNAVAEIIKDGKVVATIQLDDKGKGKFIDPPNGTGYKAVQVVNGVKSEPAKNADGNDDIININRTYHHPKIHLLGGGNSTITDKYGEGAMEFVYAKNPQAENKYTEPGAYATDKEDDKKDEAVDSNDTHDPKLNKDLTVKIEIENPMFSTSKNDKIVVTNPALNEDGTPKTNGSAANTGNAKPFAPFVGKYQVKYSVLDSDDMLGEKIRLVRVLPPAPTVEIPEENVNSELKIDALTSASVYLYNEEGKPITIKDGVVSVISSDKEHKDEHIKLKMQKHDDITKVQKGSIKGLPEGTYKLKQRLYGLDSAFAKHTVNSSSTEKFVVKKSQNAPVIKLKGSASEVVILDETYEDPEIEVSDKEDDGDNDESTKPTWESSGTVNTSVVGTYTITYTAKDSDYENASDTDKPKHKSVAIRTVVVKPPMPKVEIGDYVDGVFTKNKNGNDIRVSKIKAGAEVQLVKGSDGNGALYAVKSGNDIKDTTNDIEGKWCIFENLVKTSDISDEYGVFQTVNEIQSPKAEPYNISKTNGKPKLTLKKKTALVVEKGSSDNELSTGTDIATAKDNEDDDAKLTEKIRIYKKTQVDISDDGTVSIKKNQTGAKSIDDISTTTVGTTNYFYAVKDTDGNWDIEVKEVDVLPKAPTLNTDSKDKIVVSGLERGAIAELYKIEKGSDGKDKEVLVATKKETAGNKVEFTDLETGEYVAKQIKSELESKASKKGDFANPAYLNTKVIDSEGNALKDVKVSITDVDNTDKSVKSDDKGVAHFGVESAGHVYDISIEQDGNTYKVKGTSSEDKKKLGTKTMVVGAILERGDKISIPSDKLRFEIQKKNNNNKWEVTHEPKVVYKDGMYKLDHVEASKEYKLNVVYHYSSDKKDLAIGEFKVSTGAEGTIKIEDQKLSAGTVQNSSGTALSGVTLEIHHTSHEEGSYGDKLSTVSVSGLKGSNTTMTTDSDGKYGFAVENKVAYVIVAKKSGYKDKVVTVESVDGELLSEKITMEAGSNGGSGGSSTKTPDAPTLSKTDEKTLEVSGLETGAKVKLYLVTEDGSLKLVSTKKSSSGEDLTFGDLEAGKYVVKQIKNGKESEESNKVVLEEKAPDAPTLSKTDEKTLEVSGLEDGAEVKLYQVKEDGTLKLVSTKKSSSGEAVTFGDLSAGKYVAKQTKGEKESEASNKVELKGKVVEEELDAPTLVKTDEKTLEVSGLKEGVSVNLYRVKSDGTLKFVSTEISPAGKNVTISDLKAGKYVVKQTKDGKESEKSNEVVLKGAETQKKPKAPTLTKTDTKTVKVSGLKEGANVRLYLVKADGTLKLVSTKTSSSGEDVTFGGLLAGKYVAKQERYSKESDASNTVELKELVIEKLEAPTLSKTNEKTVIVSGVKAGETVKLYLVKADGTLKPVGTKTSFNGGRAIFNDLPAGKYIAKKEVNGKESDASNTVELKEKSEENPTDDNEKPDEKPNPENPDGDGQGGSEGGNDKPNPDEGKPSDGDDDKPNDGDNSGDSNDDSSNADDGDTDNSGGDNDSDNDNSGDSSSDSQSGGNDDDDGIEEGKEDSDFSSESGGSSSNASDDAKQDNKENQKDKKDNKAQKDSKDGKKKDKDVNKTENRKDDKVEGSNIAEPSDTIKPVEKTALISKEDKKGKDNATSGDGSSNTSRRPANDVVSDDSYVHYQSENKDKDDKVVKEPEKGKVFVNPVTGSVMYIPKKHAEGSDQFEIETKDKSGKKLIVKKEIEIEQGVNANYKPSRAVVLEMSAPKRKQGFDGDEFKLRAKFKNNMGRSVGKSTIAVEIPEGFDVVGNEYPSKNGYILIPVDSMKNGAKSYVEFDLKANGKQKGDISVNAVIQEDSGKSALTPESASSVRLNVLNQNTKYTFKPYIKGSPDGDFHPRKNVTRAEIATMLARCLVNNDSSLAMGGKATKIYSDVPENAWFAKYVNFAVEQGLFDGTSGGQFKPNEYITRGELAAVIGNYLQVDISEVGVVNEYYSDIENHWAKDSINALKRYGIAIGTGDGKFRPDAPITREATVKMINNMLNRVEIPDMTSSFGDTDNSQWSFKHIESAYRGYHIEDVGGDVTVTPLK